MINLALFGWPVVAAILAARLHWPHALLAILIGGYLLLPEAGGINLPLLPTFNKESIPALSAFLLALMLRPGQTRGRLGSPQDVAPLVHARPGWVPRSPIVLALLSVFVLGTLLTALTNGDRLTFANTSYFRPGLTLYDGFSMVLANLPMILCIILGRKYFAHPDTHVTLLWGIALAGLAYSLPTLFEVRMSPRLNLMVYGFFPHDWHQHVRSGGFRPVVFLQHGLLLAIFMAMVAVALVGLSRIDARRRIPLLLGACWILGTLVVSNSLTGLLVAVVMVPVALMFGARLQLLLAAIIAGTVLLYPTLRQADIIPTDGIVAVAERINPSRALSLNFRFENEDLILDHAQRRPLLGWGSFGRNRIYDDEGRGIDTVDGAWIVAFATGGWVRYLTQFGLLTLPLLVFAARRRSFEVTLATSILALMMAANMIDLIPNAGLSPLTWLMAGALLGRLELGAVQTRQDVPETGSTRPLRDDPALARGQARRDATTGAEARPDTAVDARLTAYTRQRKRHVREPSGSLPRRRSRP